VILLCTVILLLGVREYSFINIAITLLNIVVIVSIIAVGAWHFDDHKWSNFMGPGQAMGSLEGIITG
jgi:amino acid transporter